MTFLIEVEYSTYLSNLGFEFLGQQEQRQFLNLLIRYQAPVDDFGAHS